MIGSVDAGCRQKNGDAPKGERRILLVEDLGFARTSPILLHPEDLESLLNPPKKP